MKVLISLLLLVQCSLLYGQNGRVVHPPQDIKEEIEIDGIKKELHLYVRDTSAIVSYFSFKRTDSFSKEAPIIKLLLNTAMRHTKAKLQIFNLGGGYPNLFLECVRAFDTSKVWKRYVKQPHSLYTKRGEVRYNDGVVKTVIKKADVFRPVDNLFREVGYSISGFDLPDSEHEGILPRKLLKSLGCDTSVPIPDLFLFAIYLQPIK